MTNALLPGSDVRRDVTSHRQGHHPGAWRLAACILVTLGSGLLIGLTTRPGDWYAGLDKAPLNPPSSVFGPVWTVLYVMIAVAAYLAWTAPVDTSVRPAASAYVGQLVLNLGWSLIFFGAQRPGWALAEILLLLAAVIATMVLFARRRRAAAWLLVPYVLWVAFATYLTASIVILN